MRGQSLLSLGLIVAGLAACCQAQVFSWGRCPDVQVKEDFNTTAYFGKWYEILRFNRTSFEEGTRCNYAVYSPAEDGRVGVRNAALRGQEVDSVEGVAYAPDPSVPAKLKVKFGESWFPGDYWVLDTDYKTYSLVHSCTGFFFFNFQLNWVLSPLRNAPTETVAGALDKFTAAGVDTSQFIQTNQTRCPDF